VPAGAHQAFAYRLQSDAAGVMNTYAVFVYGDDGRADSVQVTGVPWPGAWTFAGLTLGALQATVANRLGAPMQTQKTGDAGTVQWNYGPWTFSFEIKDGVVSSIRIAKE
jgi:hypothetical protein